MDSGQCGKTEYLTSETAEQIQLNEALRNIDHFKYLGSVINQDGTINKKMWTYECKPHGQAGGK